MKLGCPKIFKKFFPPYNLVLDPAPLYVRISTNLELVILDETSGKEKASVSLSQRHRVRFIDRDSFLVMEENSLSLFTLSSK